MKMSEAILKGMEQFPRNARWRLQYGRHQACVIGCANYGAFGNTRHPNGIGAWHDECDKFFNEYGIYPHIASNRGLPRDVIAGMLAAIGE